jgi:2-desacetyl-2-hydroxyethyl bacteriochlorophyllide A dehydrogenase
MKAAVFHGKHDLRVEEVDYKKVEENEVLIEVKYCGVCGTDVHIYNGDGGSFEVTPPLIPGHELSGVVAAVGERVTTVAVGDHVSVDPNQMCGECYFCMSGKQHFCTNNIGYGTTADGGFAQCIVTHEKQVYKVPKEMSFLTAAMAEPMACCLNGMDLCNIKLGDTVLVMGGGPVGIIMLQLAIYDGASKVILSEPVKEKRELALKLGADMVIDPLTEDIDKILKDNFKNIDVVIECAGNIKVQEDAIRLAGKGATVMYFGLAGPDESFPLKTDDIFKKELKVTSSFINPYTFERALQVLESGRIDVESIITNIVPLDEIVDVFTKPEYRTTGKVMIKM